MIYLNGSKIETLETLEAYMLEQGLSESIKSYLRNDFGGQENTPVVLPKPRILKYALVYNKHFHAINHNTELSITTKVKEFFGQQQKDLGLLIKKEYYADDDLTELLFRVEYEYKKNFMGHLTHQKVLITFINEDGTDNGEVKDKGFAAYSPAESRDATRKRREAVIYLLENSLIELLSQAPGGVENIAVGAQFLEAAAPAVNKFYNSGLVSAIESFLEDQNTLSTFPFLRMEVMPGLTVAQFIVMGVTYE